MTPGETIGPFTIDRELGSGAMGTVYKATFHKDGKDYPVAFKVVSFGLLGNEGALARFDREASWGMMPRRRQARRRSSLSKPLSPTSS